MSSDSKAARAAPLLKGEKQAELIAKADAETKAGKVEPAIAAYLDAEKVAPLNDDDARTFAAALRTNGEALMTKGEPRRALANFTKAIAVAPKEEENAKAIGAWLGKWDEANKLYSEDALATSLAEDLPGDLPASVMTAIAGVYIEHAKRLAADGDDPWRASKVFDMARAMDGGHAQLREAVAEAEPRISEQVRAMIELDATVDDELTKHPGADAVSVIAKRQKVDPQIVRAAVEAMATRRQDLLDKLQATQWGVVADVEASVVRRTKLGFNTAELKLVLTGCDPSEHALLARAALDGIVEKLPKDVDSMRAPIAYKGLRCDLTATGSIATWRRGDAEVEFDGG